MISLPSRVGVWLRKSMGEAPTARRRLIETERNKEAASPADWRTTGPVFLRVWSSEEQNGAIASREKDKRTDSCWWLDTGQSAARPKQVSWGPGSVCINHAEMFGERPGLITD